MSDASISSALSSTAACAGRQVAGVERMRTAHGSNALGTRFRYGLCHRLQVFMTTEVVALIALVVFLVIAVSKSFAGAVRLSPEPFQRQLALVAAQSAR